MSKKIATILIEYESKISDVLSENLNDFNVVEKGLKISRCSIQEMRIYIRKNNFSNTQDEINFFKNQKPFVYGRLKFFVKLYSFLTHRPLGIIKNRKAFLALQIKSIESYFQKNLDFVKYYRNRRTILDEFYFIRGKDSLNLIADSSHFYTDAEFSTSHDSSVAKIIAYDLLLSYYLEELNKLEHQNTNSDNPVKRHFKSLDLGWTANKIDLIELIYALQASGAIKGGKAGIKDMAMACEQIFDMELGNYYRKFLEIRSRKIEPTKFLDRMKSSLLKRMQEADD